MSKLNQSDNVVKKHSISKSMIYNNLSFRDGSILYDREKSKSIVSSIINKIDTAKHKSNKNLGNYSNLIPNTIERKYKNLSIEGSVMDSHLRSKTPKISPNDLKAEREDFYKLFNTTTKDVREVSDNNEIELEVFTETEKKTMKELNSKNKFGEGLFKQTAENSDFNDLVPENIVHIIHCTFAKYFEGKAIFVSSDDSIFSIAAPLVGMKLKQGDKLCFSFEKKESLEDKTKRINNIISSFLVN